jgi:hypothetical protein
MSPSAQKVRHASQSLAQLLDSMASCPAGPGSVSAEVLATAFSEVSKVGAILNERAVTSSDPELEEAFRGYRVLLERLRASMPDLQARLLTERARLEAQRSHLENANIWAEVSRLTR